MSSFMEPGVLSKFVWGTGELVNSRALICINCSVQSFSEDLEKKIFYSENGWKQWGQLASPMFLDWLGTQVELLGPNSREICETLGACRISVTQSWGMGHSTQLSYTRLVRPGMQGLPPPYFASFLLKLSQRRTPNSNWLHYLSQGDKSN